MMGCNEYRTAIGSAFHGATRAFLAAAIRHAKDCPDCEAFTKELSDKRAAERSPQQAVTDAQKFEAVSANLRADPEAAAVIDGDKPHA